MMEEPRMSLDQPAMEVELAPGLTAKVEFSLELTGTTGDGGHLYHFVCVPCREMNPRHRDEWVSSPVLADEPNEQSKAMMMKALKQCQEHVRAHELIGQWALGAQRKEPLPR